METYIYEKSFSFSDEFCDEFIDANESNIKRAYVDEQNEKYHCTTINLEKHQELLKMVKVEIEDAFKSVRAITNDPRMDEYMLILNKYEILKFEQTKDYKSYSYDFKVLEGNVYSYFEVIIFLNTVEDGGEVEIMGKTKIRAEKGKLLIFPSGWCFPYCHKTPISDDQYLIRGKIFKKF